MKNILRFVHSGGLLSELNARSHRSRITLLLCTLVLMALCCFLLIIGCSKSNGPTAPSAASLLQGNQAFHASTVAEYQSLGAGVSYPFAALKIASPSSSPLHSISAENSFSRSHGSPALKRASVVTDALTFSQVTNLYNDYGTINGKVFTRTYYSDAAGTQSAGSLTITYPATLDFPININAAQNITGGNLPCKGNVLISFLDETGANLMTGTLTLTKNNVVFNLNLTLDKQLGVAGSITITESGATLLLTNFQGMVENTLACDVNVSPYGWTGTGTLNFETFEMTANVNTGTGLSTAASDSLGDLYITYADGTHEITLNALGGGLTGGTTTITPASITATSGTPQSVAVNTIFASPLVATVRDQSGNPMSGITVTFAAPSTGQSGTFTGGVSTVTALTNTQGQAQVAITANATTGSYNATASVIGVTQAASFSLTNTALATVIYKAPLSFTYSQRTIVAINNNGQSVGYQPNSSGYNVIPVYWATPTAQPQTLQISVGDSLDNVNGFNDNGQIVGNGIGQRNYGTGISSPTNPLYWSSPTAQPKKLAVPPAITGYAVATSINNNGQIVGWGWATTVMGIYWASPSDTTPQVLQPPPGSIRGVSIGPNGQIIATYGTNGMYAAFYSSPTAQPVALKFLSGDSYAVPVSVNAAGVIVGYSYSTGVGPRAVTWADFTAPPQALPVLPGSSGGASAVSINTKGDIVGALWSGAPGLIWINGQAQVQDLNTLIPSGSISGTLGGASLITDQGWILGKASSGQYILIPK